MADDGRNVVIHEFAHQLDQENGAPQGAPPPAPGNTDYNAKRWSQVFQAAFAALQSQEQQGYQGLISHYGALDPAEFFAVVSGSVFRAGAGTGAVRPCALPGAVQLLPGRPGQLVGRRCVGDECVGTPGKAKRLRGPDALWNKVIPGWHTAFGDKTLQSGRQNQAIYQPVGSIAYKRAPFGKRVLVVILGWCLC